ncbi:competence protein ComK [Metabacillus fastidiosus]|uniref:competence protein ComK n=1 Tax=Metabacillus fastidiosus TaxID=1458 RepID=UPI002DBAF65A|nr:competence protein ComK [Metabacillus fastidiosus]MEC2077570.1 competence protein ComK [Metabacillus fastidiosus]MED4533724.1 competence protein ComK [Metabacillus fastidiosus]
MTDNYKVNRMTMAILPQIEGTKLFSTVFEAEQEFTVKKKPIHLIEGSCAYFGSSYEGRKDGTRELMGVTHKSPIVIDPTSSIYFFPTTSPTRPQCAWLSHAYVLEYKQTGYDDTEVTFIGGKTVIIPISLTSFENQLFRTAQLRTIMSSRIEKEQHKMNMMLFSKESEIHKIYKQIIRELHKPD